VNVLKLRSGGSFQMGAQINRFSSSSAFYICEYLDIGFCRSWVFPDMKENIHNVNAAVSTTLWRTVEAPVLPGILYGTFLNIWPQWVRAATFEGRRLICGKGRKLWRGHSCYLALAVTILSFAGLRILLNP